LLFQLNYDSGSTCDLTREFNLSGKDQERK
jgi:hypothetical protein